LLDRLCGLETEYAIRFSPVGSERPSNEKVYDAYAVAVASLVETRPGVRERELFLANGGAVHYEALAYAHADGLVEGATPECRGPNEALLYQRAQDALLVAARPFVEKRVGGEVGLLKNCRDAAGHIYGAQENYDVDIARGGWLVVWRVGLALVTPLVLVSLLVVLALFVALIAVALPVVLVGAFVSVALERKQTVLHRALARMSRPTQLALWHLEKTIWELSLVPFLLLCRAVAFRHLRPVLTPFMISRPIITGAGTLDGDAFALSEKGIAVRRRVRIGLGNERVIFDAGNLCKQVPKLWRYLRLYRRRQRLQLGLSDSNMAQIAEYLKLATTCLVIDLAEQGLLDDLPRVRHPIRALHAIVRDPTLTTKVAMSDGTSRTAIEIQRMYIARAKAAAADDLEASTVVGRWSQIVDRLEAEPDALVGWLDWITKRALLAASDDAAARKKIDLKYHELEVGYFAQLEAAGLAPTLVTADEARAAWTEPPQATPARARARLIADLDTSERVRMT